MNVLLDTPIGLWWLLGSERLSAAEVRALAHGLNLASHDKAIRASGVVPIWKASG